VPGGVERDSPLRVSLGRLDDSGPVLVPVIQRDPNRVGDTLVELARLISGWITRPSS